MLARGSSPSSLQLRRRLLGPRWVCWGPLESRLSLCRFVARPRKVNGTGSCLPATGPRCAPPLRDFQKCVPGGVGWARAAEAVQALLSPPVAGPALPAPSLPVLIRKRASP